MAEKALIALITVVVGIGAALALYWLLNKLAELMPEKMGGTGSSPTSTSLRRSSRSCSTSSTRRS